MFFWGAKNRYYTQLCCSARVRSWPLAAAPIDNLRGSFRGYSGHAIATVERQIVTQSEQEPILARTLYRAFWPRICSS